MNFSNLITILDTMKGKKELKYNKWKEYLTNTRDRTNYSTRRMDLLIISICGAGLYIIFETLREFKTGDISIDQPNLLLFSGLSFLIAIASNFISQMTGYSANNNEEKYILEELEKMEGEKIDDCQHKNIDNKIQDLNTWTKRLNYVSISLMFLGLVLLTVFNFYLF